MYIFMVLHKAWNPALTSAALLQGARQQGIKEHVKVKKKHDVTGVGAVSVYAAVQQQSSFCLIAAAPEVDTVMQLEAVAKARDWTAGMAAYDLVLAKMKPVTTATESSAKQPRTSTRKKKRKQPEPTEGLVTLAAVPQAVKAVIPKESKSKKRKNKQVVANTDSSTDTAATAQALPVITTAAATVVAPKAVASTQQAKGRHVGRYHRVTAAKKAKGYSSSDLAAILGVEALPAAVPAAVTASPSTAQVPFCSTEFNFNDDSFSYGNCVRSESAFMLHSVHTSLPVSAGIETQG